MIPSIHPSIYFHQQPTKKLGGSNQNFTFFTFLKCRLCDVTMGVQGVGFRPRRLIRVRNVALKWECLAYCGLRALISGGRTILGDLCFSQLCELGVTGGDGPVASRDCCVRQGAVFGTIYPFCFSKLFPEQIWRGVKVRANLASFSTAQTSVATSFASIDCLHRLSGQRRD